MSFIALYFSCLSLIIIAWQVAGGTTREVEGPRNAAIGSYMGAEVKQALDQAKEFFEELGGYPLPQARV